MGLDDDVQAALNRKEDAERSLQDDSDRERAARQNYRRQMRSLWLEVEEHCASRGVPLPIIQYQVKTGDEPYWEGFRRHMKPVYQERTIPGLRFGHGQLLLVQPGILVTVASSWGARQTFTADDLSLPDGFPHDRLETYLKYRPAMPYAPPEMSCQMYAGGWDSDPVHVVCHTAGPVLLNDVDIRQHVADALVREIT